MNILFEYPTGYGKSKKALEITDLSKPTLIVVPRNVLKQNWLDECKKWGFDTSNITFSTYASLHKQTAQYHTIIFDEAQHISDRCQNLITSMNYNNAILLSATLKREHKTELKYLFPNLIFKTISFRKAVEDNKLPDPKVILVPLELDNTKASCTYVQGKGVTIKCLYRDRFKYKKCRLEIACTPRQYYSLISDQIEWYKQKSYGVEAFRNLWMQKAKQRLDWLSYQKVDTCKYILNELNSYRTLTFCSSVEQTTILGEYCINSKNKDSIKNLADFNNGKINHITACNMLNEGANLTNCKIGLYANLNSSEIIVKQRLGRILRHPEPVIILPFYTETRDQELVTKMLQDYNADLIIKCDDITQLKNLI